jgi:Na+-transporting NADH:ubiquinone oxidoreductase subunit A
VQFTAPGSGTVRAIHRGARRVLQAIVVDLDETATPNSDYAYLADAELHRLSKNDIRAALCTSGLWTAFRTRPYDKIPQSDSEPCSIFVTAIETRPLAGDPEPVVAQHEKAFAAGLQVLARLIDGAVHVCTGPDWKLSLSTDEQIRHHRFGGPHPAGLPGTHIHHIDPVDSNRTVWHIGYQDVIAAGKLFTAGDIWTERIVALGGTGFARPRLLGTRLGANIHELVADELRDDLQHPQRIVSGPVLTGTTAVGTSAWLGRYDLQLSTLDDFHKRRRFGWLGLLDGSYSFASRLARQQRQKALHEFSTAAFGRPTAMIPIDAFDRLIPMDILTVPLLKALLIQDTDQAAALGCLELDAEDLALCSFVCPGKNNYGAALRANLAEIEKDG